MSTIVQPDDQTISQQRAVPTSIRKRDGRVIRFDSTKIVDIQIRGLLKRLEDRKIHVELTDAAKAFIVSEGYDPTYGARPLKRTIQRRVLDPLALRVLEGEFREGDRIGVDVGKDGLTFEKKHAVTA